jgi:hypothetical protein
MTQSESPPPPPGSIAARIEELLVRQAASDTVLRAVVLVLRQAAPAVEPAFWALIDPAPPEGMAAEDAEIAARIQAQIRLLIGEVE